MKKPLIIQFRNDISAEHEISCIVDKAVLNKDDVTVLNAIDDDINQNPKEILKNISYIMLGGSGQFDISKRPEPLMKGIEKVKPLLEYVFENDFPTLGICMGFQVLGHLLGGSIEANPNFAETGTLEIFVTKDGKNDKFFSKLPKTFLANQGHKDSLVNNPDSHDFVVLANSKRCPVSAFRYKQNIYAVQFHPELSIDDIEFRWTLYPTYIESKSEDELKAMRDELSNTPEAAQFVLDFVTFYS